MNDDAHQDPSPPLTVHSLVEDQSSDSGHALVFVREIERDERTALLHANDVVVTLARDHSFGRCVALLQVVQDRLAELSATRPPSANLLPALVAALFALRAALSECAATVEEVALKATSGMRETPLLTDAVMRTRESTEWLRLSQVAEGPTGFHYHESGAILWRDDETLDVWALANQSVWLAQLLQIELFSSVSSEIENACRQLRQVSVEVLSGRVAIVEHPKLTSGDALSNLKPTPLALDDVPSVMSALHRAKRFQEASQEPSAASPDPSASPPIDTTPIEPPSSETPDDPASAEVGDDPLEAFDLEGLVSLASTLLPELSKEWSRALNEALLVPALSKQVAALSGLLEALQRRFKDQDRLLELLGGTSTIEGWPLSPRMLGELEISPKDHLDLERQLRLAQLQAIQDLIETSAVLRRPSTTTLSLGDEERVDRFWDNGGFAKVERRIESLRRLIDEHEIALKSASDPDSSPHPARQPWTRLKLAERALYAGDHEAVMFHARASMQATLSVRTDELRKAVLGAMAGRPDLVPFVPSAELVLEASRRLNAGEPVEIGAVTLLAEIAVGIAGALQFPFHEQSTANFMDLADEIEQTQNRVHPINDPQDEDASDV